MVANGNTAVKMLVWFNDLRCKQEHFTAFHFIIFFLNTLGSIMLFAISLALTKM